MNEWHNDLALALPLDGVWDFALAGKAGTIRVPGAWEAQGFPRRVEGPAVYRCRVTVPAGWSGQRVQLQFGAVSYHAEVAVNGIPVGSHVGSWSPFALDVTGAIHPGAENEIVVSVIKPGGRFPLRESLAGFLPDVCVMFGGIWQSVRLVAFPGPALSEIRLWPDADTGEVRIGAMAHGAAGLRAAVRLLDPDGREVAASALTPDGAAFPDDPMRLGAAVYVPDLRRWGPDHPARYTAEISLEGESGVLAVVRRRFGFRRLRAAGVQLLLNDQPVCVRGVLNWGWYPDLLCPAPDESAIRDEFRRVRALGYNMVKLCLYVPVPRYFEIADEEGMLLWLELPLWLPDVTPRLRQQAPLEYAAIFGAVHHHPSVILYSLGCELDQAADADLLGQLDRIARDQTCGALICDNSGSGEAYGGLAHDFADFNDYHFYCDLHYFDPLVDHFRRDWRPRPWIFGEFCDADDYRDLDEIAAAMPEHGGDLPWWLTEPNPIHAAKAAELAYPEQRTRMARLALDLDGQALQQLSRRQSFIVRKTILEKVRARQGMGGYVVTGIRDTPLATSSMFDDLGRFKYDAEAFRAFNDDTVLLIGQGRRRIWQHGGDRPAPAAPRAFLTDQPVALDVILSHAGGPLPGGALVWRITGTDGTAIASGMATINGPLAGGRPCALTRIAFRTPPREVAAMLMLEVTLDVSGHQHCANRWPLWVFPAVSVWPQGIGLLDPGNALLGLDDLCASAAILEPGAPIAGISILITSVLSAEVRDYLHRGGAVLLLQHGPRPIPAAPCPFWREGVALIADHPVMNAIPHEGVLDVQFYGLATDYAFAADGLVSVLPEATDVRPLMRRLAVRAFTVSDHLVEARVGAGRIIASTLRFEGGAGDQPAGLRFHPAGRWLLQAILRHLLDGSPA